MHKGDIVLIPFPFSDLSGQKIRPALLLFVDQLQRDMIVAFLTSKASNRGSHDFLVKKSKNNGLKVDSVLRLTKLATLDTKIAIARIGTIESVYLDHARKNLFEMFT